MENRQNVKSFCSSLMQTVQLHVESRCTVSGTATFILLSILLVFC